MALSNKQPSEEKYPDKYKSGIAISKAQWLEMLQDNTIFRERDINFISQIYLEKNHAATCSELALENSDTAQSYNSRMVNLAKRVLSHLGEKPELGEKGKDRSWNVIFIGRHLKQAHFEWKLRPELENAVHDLYPNLRNNEEGNNELDTELVKDISESSFTELTIDRKKPKSSVINGVKVYPGKRQNALYALEKANHRCEIDESHPTFTRKADSLPYTEPHHLIPMSMQDKFEVSIDVPENIVSLCGNCHNEIHYRRDAKKLMTRLYEARRKSLSEVGTDITLEELLAFYQIN